MHPDITKGGQSELYMIGYMYYPLRIYRISLSTLKLLYLYLCSHLSYQESIIKRY